MCTSRWGSVFENWGLCFIIPFVMYSLKYCLCLSWSGIQCLLLFPLMKILNVSLHVYVCMYLWCHETEFQSYTWIQIQAFCTSWYGWYNFGGLIGHPKTGTKSRVFIGKFIFMHVYGVFDLVTDVGPNPNELEQNQLQIAINQSVIATLLLSLWSPAKWIVLLFDSIFLILIY